MIKMTISIAALSPCLGPGSDTRSRNWDAGTADRAAAPGSGRIASVPQASHPKAPTIVLQCVTAHLIKPGDPEMANKTLVEKAAEKVGYGLAMAEDVAGTVRTAIGSVADALKTSPVRRKTKKASKKAAGATAVK